MQSILDLLRCPRCRCSLVFLEREVACTNPNCAYASSPFPYSGGQPVLIDFERSIFERSMYVTGSGSALPRDEIARSRTNALHRFISGSNPVAAAKCAEMIARMKAETARPLVLVVGGGKIGVGAEALYSDPALRIVGTDVYATANTCALVDGHHLPFQDQTFDGVWIQAVLEHVLEPHTVVDEIWRVLKPGGMVYSDTPFMQQVHEGAYDFTRFTQSGHRWLFRRFEQLDAGAVGGASTATLWSIRYLARALGASHGVAMLIALPFFWLRFLDRYAGKRANADAASSTYFLGRKTNATVSPQELVRYYEQP